jgi:hypothetical protein
MKSFLFQVLCGALCLASACAEPAPQLTKTPVLPLALDDTIQFRKNIIFVNDPKNQRGADDDMINLQRLRVNYGAVTQFDRQQRWGNYYDFYWRTLRPATELTVRFEYRQEKLGNFVQAQERSYKNVKKGVTESKFMVIGDDFNNEGRVTAWRAIIIENGKIVALNQSYLWR